MPEPPAAPPVPGLARLAAALHDAALATRQRRLLLLTGTRAWCHAATTAAAAPIDLWIGDRAPPGVPWLPAARAVTRLGREHASVVFDAHAGLDVDALAAVAGTLRAGGLLWLLAPPLDAWPGHPDPALVRLLSSPATPADASGRFVARLAALLGADPAITHCTEGAAWPEPPAAPATAAAPLLPDADGCATADQRRAVDAVVDAARSGRPAVLTADRGRGKSAALGLAAARLLAAGARRVVVTAPRRAATEALFRHAADALGLPTGTATLRTADGGELAFVPPDALVHAPPQADLVLVDEAAAIPAPLLEALLAHDRRIAFATTVHGYEGTGRGFALRFRATLDRRAPGWREIGLREPVRWAADDPLEALLFRALLLDAEPDTRVPAAGPAVMVRVDRDRLAADEPLLRALFGLLVQAHYRTSPSDLRQLLDAPGITLHAAWLGAVPVAVAVCVDEGELGARSAFAVWAGRRRLHGHLVAQSLATHAGLRDAPTLALRRVQRIAVDPRCRRTGIGRALLDHVAHEARADGRDLVATSFGLTPGLAAFWRACGYLPARLGLRREAASGAHALMLLRPLTARGEAFAEHAGRRFARQLPALLDGPLADLEPELAAPMCHGTTAGAVDGGPDADDWAEACAFAFGARGPDAAYAPLRRVTQVLANPASPGADAATLAALVARFLDGATWPAVAARLGVAGRADAIAALRAGLRPALRARPEPEIAALVVRLEADGSVPRGGSA